MRQIDVGKLHPTDPNGLVVVTQIEPISLIFTLPETDLPQIQQQMANKTPLKVLTYSQDDNSSLMSASSIASITRFCRLSDFRAPHPFPRFGSADFWNGWQAKEQPSCSELTGIPLQTERSWEPLRRAFVSSPAR